MKGDPHRFLRLRAVLPGPSIHLGTAGGMGAQGGRQRPELHPAGVTFLIATAHVTADVVGPEEATDIASRGGERNLEGQHLPTRVGVTGEVDRVAIVSPARPTAEGLTAQTISTCVLIVIMIQPGEVRQVR